MVARPEKPAAPISLAPHLFLLFCCVLVITLLPVATWAKTDPPQALGELCLLPALEKSLSQYRQLAARGGWPQVEVGPTLGEGDQDQRIPLLKKRLAASGDLAAWAAQGDLFDEFLNEAVLRFQTRHGLTADGRVGPKTLRELNVPIDERIRQLTASLARCQALPPLLEPRHILVNIADFTLKLFEDGKLVLAMPVIVGRAYRQTPVFNSHISSLILNPSWNVPHSIATKDLLPKIQKDPDYLRRMHLRVTRNWTLRTEIEPATINWAKLSQAYFPYRLRQDPGPDNALGRVKFPFPNPYDVYLHDTPARELFDQDARTFSSGCIRLAKPLELAVYLLQGTPLGSMAALTAEIANEEPQQKVLLSEPIAIHIVYLTAWVDPDGTVQFRPDVYKRDQIR